MAVNYGSKRVVVGAHYGTRDWLALAEERVRLVDDPLRVQPGLALARAEQVVQPRRVEQVATRMADQRTESHRRIGRAEGGEADGAVPVCPGMRDCGVEQRRTDAPAAEVGIDGEHVFHRAGDRMRKVVAECDARRGQKLHQPHALRFPGRDVLFLAILGTMMIPSRSR